MAYTKFTTKHLLDLIYQKESGKTIEELAAIYSVSKPRIYQLLKKARPLQKSVEDGRHIIACITTAISSLNEIKPQSNATLREYFYIQKADRAKWELETLLMQLHKDQ